MADTSPQSLLPAGTLAIGNAQSMTAMVLWSAGFPAAEALLDSWPSLSLITARLGVSVAVLLVIWMVLEGPGVILRARWGRGVIVGGIAFGFGAYLLLHAQMLTDPVTVALIASATPVAATLIEISERSRRLTIWFVLGLAASVVGGAIATGGGQTVGLGLGAVLAVGSCFLYAWGSFATVRDLPGLTPLGRTTITLTGGVLATGLVLVASAGAGADVMPNDPVDNRQLFNLGIYALAGLAVSQVLWIASVERIGVALASFHINIAPFYVMLFLLALGDGWSWPQAFGAGVVALGVIIAQRDAH